MASYFTIVQENLMVFLHIWSPCQKSSGDFDIATTSLDIYWSLIPPTKIFFFFKYTTLQKRIFGQITRSLVKVIWSIERQQGPGMGSWQLKRWLLVVEHSRARQT